MRRAKMPIKLMAPDLAIRHSEESLASRPSEENW